MSRAQQIRDLLAEGPATAAEVAAELCITVHLASAHLSSLRRCGHVTSRRFRPGTGHRHEVNLYSLTEAK